MEPHSFQNNKAGLSQDYFPRENWDDSLLYSVISQVLIYSDAELEKLSWVGRSPAVPVCP